MRKIIAILGLPGSGKTEAINYLIKRYNWSKVYFGDVTFDEMKSRGLEINEKNEREVREGLRAQFGQLIYAQRVIEKIESLPSDKNVLVESLYSWPEYLEFKKKFGDDFITIAVYASPRRRYKRLGKRPVRPLTPADCQSRDWAQIENLTQANAIAMADYTAINETTIEDLYAQVDRIISSSSL
jgi:dephospho-CoA kinase